MNRYRASRGFFLVEFIFWMVVVSLAAAGIVPLLGQVLSTLHMPGIGLQGHWLAQGVAEQMNAQEESGGFEQILPGECRKPDGNTPWVDASTPLTCQVEIRAAEPNLTTHSVDCVSQLYSDGNYKCAIVRTQHRQSNEPIARITVLFARPADSL